MNQGLLKCARHNHVSAVLLLSSVLSLASGSRSAHADSVNPTGMITVPALNSVVDSIPTVSGTAVDPKRADGTPGSGVVSVGLEFWQNWSGTKSFWDGLAWGPVLAPMPTTLSGPDANGIYSWTFTGKLPPLVPTRAYFMGLEVRDRDGNASYGNSGIIYVGPKDTTPPTVTITSPADNSTVTDLASITGTAADDPGGSGLAQVKVALYELAGGQTLYWNGKTWDQAISFLPGNEWSWVRKANLPSGADLPPGNYVIAARAYDQFWNPSAVAVSKFTVAAK